MEYVYSQSSKGFPVLWLQQALVAAGCVCYPDSVFGEKTFEAIKSIQKQNGLEETGCAGIKEFELLGLKFPDEFSRILNLCSCFENTSFHKATGPSVSGWNNAGIHWGIINFTNVTGELQRFIISLMEQIPEMEECAETIMGHDKIKEFMTRLHSIDNKALDQKYISSDGNLDYKVAILFARWGAIPAVQLAQIERARNIYWTKTVIACERLFANPPNVRSKGFIYDTILQNGLMSNLVWEAESKRMKPEMDVCNFILDKTLERYNLCCHSDIISRKTVFLRGKGKVNSWCYNLDCYAL